MKKGKQSVIFQKDIFINDAASYVGKRESEGNLRDYFQNVLKDDLMKEKSYELAETKMQKMTVEKLFEVSGKTANDFDCIMGGDLQNQIFATSFCAREFDIPFFGLYGACSTFGEGLCAGGLFIESGNFKNIIVVTSSHFSSAERNYRFPLELGNQRTPLSQWTVTASGAVLVDFWASWCGPCKMLSPVLSEIADEYADVLRVAKVNVDDEPELAMKFKVSSIPMLVFFKDGRIVSTSVGYRPKDEILNELKLYMNQG